MKNNVCVKCLTILLIFTLMVKLHRDKVITQNWLKIGEHRLTNK